MHKKVYTGSVDRLRRPERLEILQVEKVIDLCLNGRNIQSALDAGTGSGIFAEAFHKRGLAVAGFDLNTEMIKAAREHVPDGEFKTGDHEDIPFPDKSYDLVFYAHSLHEADNLTDALSEAKRVARMTVIALEWPFKIRKHGPPLWHRIPVWRIKRVSTQLGYSNFHLEKVGDQNLFILTV